jgi:hypothetical protein
MPRSSLRIESLIMKQEVLVLCPEGVLRRHNRPGQQTLPSYQRDASVPSSQSPINSPVVRILLVPRHILGLRGRCSNNPGRIERLQLGILIPGHLTANERTAASTLTRTSFCPTLEPTATRHGDLSRKSITSERSGIISFHRTCRVPICASLPRAWFAMQMHLPAPSLSSAEGKWSLPSITGDSPYIKMRLFSSLSIQLHHVQFAHHPVTISLPCLSTVQPHASNDPFA